MGDIRGSLSPLSFINSTHTDWYQWQHALTKPTHNHSSYVCASGETPLDQDAVLLHSVNSVTDTIFNPKQTWIIMNLHAALTGWREVIQRCGVGP